MKVTIKSKPTYNKKGGEKRMKNFKNILPICMGIFALATLVTFTSWAAENVRNSKHNLSVNPNIGATGTTEVCIFCHTPHGGDTSTAGTAAPLWNRNMTSMTASGDFTPYSSPNFDGLGNTAGYPKGVSLACLSCHDGSIAFDSLINFPGSGSTDGIGFDASGSSTPKVDSNGKMINVGDNLFPMLGVDLSNDHPISMEIPCGNDPQFDNEVYDSTAEKQICNNLNTGELSVGRISALYRGSNNTVLHADKRNWIRAYPTAGGGKPYIECASCHNPHEENNGERQADGSVTILDGFTGTARDTRFLRYPSFVGTDEETAIGATVLDSDRNAGSLLCLSCHNK